MGDSLVLAGSITLERREAIARAMEAPSGGEVQDEVARGFRVFAKQSGNDLEALAAMQRGRGAGFDASKLKDVRMPVMILVGRGDTLVGGAEKLADKIPGAKLVTVPGDHLAPSVTGVQAGARGLLRQGVNSRRGRLCVGPAGVRIDV